MSQIVFGILRFFFGAVILSLGSLANAQGHPLPSWHDTASRRAIVEFVGKVTQEGSPDYVPAPERIATFDNDGALWAEQPMYFQAFFIVDRIKALAPKHPEWTTQEPFASVLKGDMKKTLAGGEKALLEMAMATHAGMSTEEFEQIVKDWIATAKHPKTGRPFTEMVYQPMRELLAYLRANGFKTYIVSGGGIEFMRPWTEKVYGVPPEQVIGSSIKTKYEIRDGKPVLVRLPEINFIDDKDGKPIAINQHIGRRPIAAFGNSDGDLQMLQMDDCRRRAALRAHRPPYRCRTRMGLRPQVAHRQTRQGARRSASARLDGGGYEARLEDGVRGANKAMNHHPA